MSGLFDSVLLSSVFKLKGKLMQAVVSEQAAGIYTQ